MIFIDKFIINIKSYRVRIYDPNKNISSRLMCSMHCFIYVTLLPQANAISKISLIRLMPTKKAQEYFNLNFDKMMTL